MVGETINEVSVPEIVAPPGFKVWPVILVSVEVGVIAIVFPAQILCA
jgi:hypothetical protein